MNKMGWKVVRKYGDGALESAVATGTWSCRYGIGQRTEGHKGTPVLAFRSRQNARNFRYSYGRGTHIFKARLENARCQSIVSFADDYTSFWASAERFTVLAPDGTLACDAITLLEPA